MAETPAPRSLDTAADPGGLRRIVIDPVTRVEGHARVTILVDDAGRVQQARLHVTEFRGFEKFIEGRPYWEVPVLVQRLCGICPISHHLAASKALDQVVGAPTVTPTADRIRRLMHHGQTLQSHALHFFHLSSPDLLFGTGSGTPRRGFEDVAAAHPGIARKGVALRRYGQEIIRATAGKRVHGTGSVPGGVNRHVAAHDLDALRAEAPQMLAHCEEAIDIVAGLHRADAAFYDGFARFPSRFLSLVRPGDGTLDLYDGVLRVRDADGRTLVDNVPADGFADLIEEDVRPWSYAKFPYLRALGPDGGWYRVGPLARLQTCERLPTARAETRRQEFLAHGGGRPQHGSLAYHWARMIEMLLSMEVITELLDDPHVAAGELRAGDPADARRPAAGEREGIAVVEAPRGTLVHHYRVGDDDLVTHCTLIVPTTYNNRAVSDPAAKCWTGCSAARTEP
jgi:NAD-reducing hydrogenase large subunit